MTDITYRTGYGTSSYGSYAYGFNGAFKEGAAAVIGITTTASASIRARLVASAVVSVSTVTTSVNRIRSGSALIEATTTGAGAAPNTFTTFSQAQLSTAQSKFGTASLRTDGTFDYIRSDGYSSFGGGDYTVEFWIYRTSNPAGNQFIFDNRTGVNSGNLIYINSLGRVGAVVDGGVTGSTTPIATTLNAWHHIALVRSGSTFKFFVNGVAATNSFTANTTDYSGRIFSIGAQYFSTPGGFSFNGWIDEFRASRIARYSTAFTPPSSAFSPDNPTAELLHFDGTNGSTTITNSAVAPTSPYANAIRVRLIGATASAGASVSSSSQVIKTVSAATSSSASVSADSYRERNVSATFDPELGVSASGVALINTSATVSCEVTSLVSCRRVRLGSALSSISCIVSATAIKKWEPGSDTAETWTPQANTSEVWTAQSDTAETWTPQSDTNEAWTPVSDTAETWTEAA